MKTIADRRAIVERVRHENENDYGDRARGAVQKLLSASLPHPWTYVYELTQNALDAGAQRISWRIDGESVLFQHDGRIALNESHVRGIASLGASTKGLAHVGFMGVGFKSVFTRFRTVSVSGFGFRFKFDVGVHHGDLGQTITQWFDTLRPHWDDEVLDPDAGYTTSIRLERPDVSARTLAEDIERISSPEDQTPLAVLALRGLKQIRVDDIEWYLDVAEDVVVRRHDGESTSNLQWKSFVSRYRPKDDAMRRFLEVRQETHDQVDDSGERITREVVGLVPLDSNGLPNPPSHGLVYATLPTQVQVPLGFHLQADWFVDVDRQNLRDVDGDAWQESIVRQVPEIVRQLLVWLTEESDQARKRGYRALRDPSSDEGLLSKPFQELRDQFVNTLSDQNVVPIHGADRRQFRTPEKVARLPNRFNTDFGRNPHWRPDLLFEHDLMDEELLATSATKFTTWIGWGREIERDAVPWPDNLPKWWSMLPKDMRKDALFALWQGVGALGWHDAPVVPTEAGTWVQMSRIRWLNEAPPTENYPSGAIIATALAGYLPRPDERLPPNIRSWVDITSHDGAVCFTNLRTDVKLSSLVQEAFKDSKGKSDTRLVALLEWAMNRSINRQDLVPLVLTEQGAKRPADALLADPLVDGGEFRRDIFPDKPALTKDYAFIDDRRAVVLFLERLGLCGGDPVAETSTSVSRYSIGAVVTMLGIDEQQVSPANASGYTVLDYKFPFQLEKIPVEALQNWLSFEHAALRGKGSRSAKYFFYHSQSAQGRNGTASWVRSLQEHPWLLCTDDQRRRPADVLLEPDPDFEDAPIAKIDPSLGDRLKEEGVQFGSNVQKSPALRRLSRRGSSDMSDSELATLLREACEQVDLGNATQEDLLEALNDVRLRGVPITTSVVQQTGAGRGQRSDLGGWIATLEDVEPSLAAAVTALPLSIPKTTTGRQALSFLLDIWNKKPPHVETIRGNLAAAYRYVLDDLDSGDLAGEEWHQARDLACVYGQSSWHTIGCNLVVADVQSPLIRQFLPEGREIVASAHLGDGVVQVRRVANALDLGLLSNDVKVCPGSRVEEPSWVVRLRKLVEALSLLEDRIELQEISFRDKISLRVSGTERHINAYVLDGALLLVGGPHEFAADAAEQLVDRFRLGQRGNVVPYLTMALSSLDNKDYFRHNFKVLCEGLGVEVPEDASDLTSNEARDRSDVAGPADQSNEDDHKTDHDESGRWAENPGPHAASSANPIVQAGRMTDDVNSQMEYRDRPEGDDSAASEWSQDGEGTTQTTGNARPSPRGRAADHFGLFVEHERSEDQEPGTSRGNRRGRIDDHKARQAVIKYEKCQGRKPEEMPDNQPGYDILSVDEASGQRRRIEVKGVQGIFQGEASVVLTARQAHDAIQHREQRSQTDVEYWLYVVDSTETTSPRVFPIPWTRYNLKYGFYARVWADIAEQPTA